MSNRISFTHPDWKKPVRDSPRRCLPILGKRVVPTRPMAACTLSNHVPPVTPVDYHTSAHYARWVEQYAETIDDIIHTIRSTAIEFERSISVSEITAVQRRDIAKIVYQASSKVISDY